MKLLDVNRKNLFIVVVVSALLTIALNSIVFAEPEEWSQNGNTGFLPDTNASDINFGDNNTRKELEQNIIIMPTSNNNNITRTLQLAINFNEDNFDIDKLIDEGYYFVTQVKGNQYVDIKKFPVSMLLKTKHLITIPIQNNSSNYDDGSDLRIDVYVTHYDAKYEQVKYNATQNFNFADMNERLKQVVDDEDGENEDEEEL